MAWLKNGLPHVIMLGKIHHFEYIWVDQIQYASSRLLRFQAIPFLGWHIHSKTVERTVVFETK
jgi:hypothetical protein